MGTIRRLQLLPAGRRAKWLVLLAWIVAAAGFGTVAGRLHDATVSDPQAFLPANAPSTRVAEIQAADFPGSTSSEQALIVYQSRTTLTEADRRRIERDVAMLSAPGFLREIDPIRSPFGADAPPGSLSPDGTTALVPVQINSTDLDIVKPDVDRIRQTVESSTGGLSVHVTGTAGLAVDGFDILGNLDSTLLLATVVLIVVLLTLIYRALLITLVPLVTIGIAYAITAGLVYLLIEGADLTVTSEATSLLIILMFGAGTDYCIYLVARYREELRSIEDKHEAMRRALERTTPAILSCGLTVAGAMLVLLVADLQSTRTAGPVLAIGIGITMLAGLTLLPALMTILGRKAFWPREPRAGSAAVTGQGVYHRIGRFVVGRPVVILVVCVGALGAMTAGATIDTGTISVFQGFRKPTDSVEGQQALARAFPPGVIAPTAVVVQAPPGDLDHAARKVSAALERDPAVATVTRAGVSRGGDVAQLAVVLRDDPYGDAATGLVPGLRRSADAAIAGSTAVVLVGGPTAAEYDTVRTLSSDFHRIFPIALVLIFTILVVLLRTLVAPLYLIATVVLSFFAALGLSYACFEYLFHSGGSTAGFSTFLFIFLVALGVDYNIFLMTRIREEAAERPLREAVLHALDTTGGVITTAGLILSGTFAMLMILPLEQLFQLGFGIAVGVLLDTFVVRTLIVPALTDLLGRHAWWPTRAPREGVVPGGARPARR